MKATFLATLTPMLTLFFCMVIGFVIQKAKLVPENTSKVLAKLETWVMFPALSFATMARFFTVETIKSHATNMIFSTVSLAFAISIAIPLSFLFVRKKCYDRGVYQYALTFGNTGYVGDPLVLALFGEAVLSYFKIACLPITIAIYTWGLSVLVPSSENKLGSQLKKLVNPPIIGLLCGMSVGLLCGAFAGEIAPGSTAYDTVFPKFIVGTVDILKNCMGPLAMIIAGATIAKYDLLGMFKKKKVYIATAIRLIVIPVVVLTCIFGIKELANLIFSLRIDNTPLLFLFFILAMPLGLNTVVFPEAYGGDPETGASMALISHTLCVITIPLMLALFSFVFGESIPIMVFK